MASVDSNKKLNRIIPRHKTVQNELDKRAGQIWGRAEAGLAAHRYEGFANVGIERGDKTDRYIFLEDPPHSKYPGAAWAIETGHYMGPKGQEGRPWIEGIWVLHDAVKRERKRNR